MPGHPSIWMHELSWDEIEAQLAMDDVALLPIGATEQHGNHLPLGVDTFVVETVARRASAAAAAENVAPLVLAPTLAYGRSDHHFGFPGVLSLRSETLAAVLRDLVRSLPESGLSRLFVLNGHGGNDATLRVALADAAETYPVSVGGASYWTIAWGALREEGADRLGPLPGHAGGFETSLMLALADELVQLDLRAGPDPVPTTDDPVARVVYARRGTMRDLGGTSDDARHADAELGRRLLGVIVERTGRAIADFQRRAS
ncbi:MAG: creatininase family protein [Chloroflexi bacterium]|nr:creatininase family protein [Chloroflexota bacterium]